MDVDSDIVYQLIEFPFSERNDAEQNNIVLRGRPTEKLVALSKKVLKNGKILNLYFRSCWFDDFSWLCSSPVLQRLFCWPCLLFSNKKSVWTTTGYSDLQNIARSLHKHGDSCVHLKSEILLRNFGKDQAASDYFEAETDRLLIMQFNENVLLNRRVLLTAIDAVLYFCKHGETGNAVDDRSFQELFQLLISKSPLEVQNQYERLKTIFMGVSTAVQNELIECISDYLKERVINELRESSCFAVHLENTSSASQFALLARFVDSGGNLVERLLCLVEMKGQKTPETLYKLLTRVLDNFDYTNKLVGQSYCVEGLTAKHLDSLQRKVKVKAPQAAFVHSLTRRFNHALQQSLSNISECQLFFATVSGISSFFQTTAKRSSALYAASRVHEIRLCSDSSAVSSIIQTWDKLKELLGVVVRGEKSERETAQLAKGYLDDMDDAEFAFLAVAFNEIFAPTGLLFEILRNESLNVQFSVSQIRKICSTLNHMRSEDVFKRLFDRALKLTSASRSQQKYEVPGALETIRRRSKTLYFEILDHVVNEIGVRFQDYEKLLCVSLADSTKFQQYHSSFPGEAFESLLEAYGQMFPRQQRLKSELQFVYAEEKHWNMPPYKLLRMLLEYRDIFSGAYKLFSLLLTIPSACVLEDSSNSIVEKLETYSKNSAKRCYSAASIFAQEELLGKLRKTQPFYDDIIDKFAALEGRKFDLICKKQVSLFE